MMEEEGVLLVVHAFLLLLEGEEEEEAEEEEAPSFPPSFPSSCSSPVLGRRKGFVSTSCFLPKHPETHSGVTN